jgi:hypothetical protein
MAAPVFDARARPHQWQNQMEPGTMLTNRNARAFTIGASVWTVGLHRHRSHKQNTRAPARVSLHARTQLQLSEMLTTPSSATGVSGADPAQAGDVTRTDVRCSAWLGDSILRVVHLVDLELSADNQFRLQDSDLWPRLLQDVSDALLPSHRRSTLKPSPLRAPLCERRRKELQQVRRTELPSERALRSLLSACLKTVS